MAREVDVRSTGPAPEAGDGEAGVAAPAGQEVSAQRRVELSTVAEEVSAQLPGNHEVQIAGFDAESGGAAVLVSQGAPAQRGDYVQRALRHVQDVGRALGLAPEQPPEFIADPGYQTTSAGGVSVHLRQQVKGIPVYDAAQTVRFDTDGRLLEVAGRTFPAEEGVAVTPVLAPRQSLDAAAAHLASGEYGTELDPYGQSLIEPTLDLAAFDPQLVTGPAQNPDLATIFSSPMLTSPVTVSLVWFPLEGSMRLAWHQRLQVVGGPQYRVIMDAADGRILLCRQLSHGLVGHAQVVLRSGGPRENVSFPMPAEGHGPPVPPGLPASWPTDWLTDASTSGPYVRAGIASGSTVSGSRQGQEVSFPAPPDPNTDDQLVVNLFTFCSAMHDALYLLGFREEDGNFQRDATDRGGRPGDAVQALVHPGPVWGTANMATPRDGRPPEMNMGLVERTGRHTALDADVVYHEYTHGLSNRLVGGGMNDTALDADQSAGMGEGWSDYVACTLLGKTTVGDWVVDRSTGIRREVYTDGYSGSYADLGGPRYSRVHDIGELWAAVLMSLGRRLGRWECLQVVVDALKLTSANPSLLAARDAILLAAAQYRRSREDAEPAVAAYVHSAWQVFARYGMGPGARTDGARLSGIVPDFSAPPPPPGSSSISGQASPGLAIPDDDDAGVASVVTLPGVAPVSGLSVRVEITHTFRGDLLVTLTAPDGRTAVLHDRTGGRGEDLLATWTDSDSPALRGLLGSPAGGDWTLRVADRAAVDVGTLVSWGLTAEAGPNRSAVQLEARDAVGAGAAASPTAAISLQLDCPLSGALSAVRLELDLSHTDVGDLGVVLRGPTGKRVTVRRRRAGGPTDRLVAEYRSADGGPMAGFLGLEARGTWTLQVTDGTGKDAGKLNRCRLTCTV